MNVIENVASKFSLLGKVISIKPHGNGLINKTYYVRTTEKNYIIQKVNNYVFKNVNLLMENIYLVTKYIKKNNGHTLELVKTKTNNLLLKYQNDYYRCYIMIENSITYDNMEEDFLALKLGKIIGKFQENLLDLRVDKIKCTIPFFHDLRHRYIDLVKAYRMSSVKEKKIETKPLFSSLIMEYERIMVLPNLYKDKLIPSRICHYDTKLNNFLFTSNNQDALIDLDTVMPGCSIYDYGDCARNIIVNVNEDDYNNKIIINYQRLIYLTIGYLSVGKNYLNNIEVENMFNSIKVITLELSIRFLTDYLDGDLYFLTAYQGQNLNRALCQYHIYLKLLEEEKQIKSLIKQIYQRITIIN